MMAMVKLFQQAVQLAAEALVVAHANDLGELVRGEAKHAQLTGALEQVVDREVTPEHHIPTVLDLIQRVVAAHVNGGPIRLGKLRSPDQGPVFEALADDRGTETVGRRLQRVWIRDPQEGMIVLAESDPLPLEFAFHDERPIEGGRGLEWEE